MANKYHLKLYVIGRTQRTERAIANLETLLGELSGSGHEFEIFDILERPELADQERLLATPTLIRTMPPPPRRVIGDLSNTAAVAEALGLELKGQSYKDSGNG